MYELNNWNNIRHNENSSYNVRDTLYMIGLIALMFAFSIIGNL